VLDATPITSPRVWRTPLAPRIFGAVVVTVMISLEVGMLLSGEEGNRRSMRLVYVGLTVVLVVVFQYVRLELHAQHLVLRSVPLTRVLPLAEIEDETVGRHGLVFWCGNGRRISGPPAIGQTWWLAALFSQRTRADEMIDEILTAARRSR
jgi:hypothetical protein